MSTVNRRTFLKTGAVGAAGLSLCGPHAVVKAQPPKPAQPPQVDDRPLLRLEGGGPTTFVTSLAFSPDGQTLYAAGFDKVVRVWKLQDGRFTLDKVSYRVPIGPGLNGSINAIALSPDGGLLAAAGQGIMRGEAGFRQEGMVVPQIGGVTTEMRADQGTIFLFDTRAQTLRRLRGHLGPVRAMTFAPAREGKPAILISAARESTGKKPAGVIRVWNAIDGKEIDNLGQQPDSADRPGLVAWHTGNELKQMRIVSAWDDGVIRLWDLGQDQFTTADDGKYNIGLGYLPGQGKVVSGSSTYTQRGYVGHVRLWDARPSAEFRMDVREANFPPEEDGPFVPRAMTLFSLQRGGAPDHAVVAFRIPKEKSNRYELQIIELTPERFGQVKARIPLWTGGANTPVLAVAPRGAHLAVAGNDQHEIKIFPIVELTNRQPKFQILKSAGANFRGIAFVKKNDDLALALRPQAADEAGRTIAELKAGDLIFDFTRRSLLDDQTGWKIDAPADGDWQAALTDVEKDADGLTVRQAIILRKGNEEQRRITLKRLYEITSFAILSPRGPATVPILALAFLDDHKQPYLFLYNAETGEQVRQYAGHTDPIRSLAFSSDGRLLGSAADDQTVCVWSLTSLPKHIGQRGLIPGLAIKDDNGRLVVGKVDQDSPAGAKVEIGDVVEGLIENNQVRQLKSPREFYEAVSQRKPGQQVTVQVAGKGPVAIPVGQYIDQLNALLFLFITAAEKVAEKVAPREWIGWNPDGQFDASDRKTERLVGWHFNKGKDENSPPAFAFAEQYRKEFFKEGILKFLMATGSLSQALKAWEKEDKAKELPKPKMVFWIDEGQAGQPANVVVGPDDKKIDGQGRFLVQKREATLRLAVYDFPSRKIDSVSWGLKGEKLQPLAKSLDQEYSADLSPVLTAPGEYKLRLVLRSDEQETQEYTRDLTVRFQQAAVPVKRDATKPLPKLVLIKPAPGAIFYEEEGKANPEVELVGTLDLPNNQKFDAAVIVHDADGKDETKVTPVVKGETLTAKVPLKYKNNRVEVLLSNEGNDAVVAAETQLRYLRPPRILSIDAPKESAKPLADVAARVYSPLDVTREQVEAEVNGRDIARERIQVQKHEANNWKVELKDVPLDPAKNVVHLYVSNSEARSRQPGTATVNFQPPNPGPVVEFLSPAMDTKVTDPEIDLRFRVKSTGPLQRVEIVRDGKNAIRRSFDLTNQQPNAQGYYVFDEKTFAKELKDFPLEAKENIFRVEAVNAGGTQYASVVVNYINVPVTLTIDKIVPWDPDTQKLGDQAIIPKIRIDGGLMVDRSPQGRVKVMGQVTWGKANDAQLKKAGQVRVFVNGFQQVPATLDEPKGKERRRTFTADLVLNRSEGNFVEMDIPDIKQDASNRTEFTLGSMKPVKGQRLHLLIVGVGEKDEQKLYKQAITALKATKNPQGKHTSQAFEEVRFYGPLTGFVSPEQVYTQLCLIKKTIDLYAPRGSANDVVMVYYQGQETVDGKGHFFRTSASKFDPELHRSAITCDGLSAYFTETLGAQILLLDVIRTAPPVSLAPGEATDRISKWPDASYTGVMRYLKRIDKAGAPQDILLADLSEVMPKAMQAGKAMEWGDVLANVEVKISNEKSLVLDEKFRTPLKKLIVG